MAMTGLGRCCVSLVSIGFGHVAQMIGRDTIYLARRQQYLTSIVGLAVQWGKGRLGLGSCIERREAKSLVRVLPSRYNELIDTKSSPIRYGRGHGESQKMQEAEV